MCRYIQGHYGSIHPMDKAPVANRLLLSARQIAYNDSEIRSSGPVVRDATLLPNELRMIQLNFYPHTMSDEGLLLRTEGRVRQVRIL